MHLPIGRVASRRCFPFNVFTQTNFWSVTNGIYHLNVFSPPPLSLSPGDRLILILEDTRSLCQRWISQLPRVEAEARRMRRRRWRRKKRRGKGATLWPQEGSEGQRWATRGTTSCPGGLDWDISQNKDSQFHAVTAKSSFKVIVDIFKRFGLCTSLSSTQWLYS